MNRTQKVILVDYDPAWPLVFADLARVIGAALGGLSLSVEHVGSTSIPGMAAKPVIDVDAVIASRVQLPHAVEALAAIGYAHEGDLGIAGREAFRRAGAEVPHDGSGRAWPRHHLYVCAQDSRELARHLAFRDYLRAHPDDAQAYEALKRRLAREHPHDVDAYSEAKSGFIEDILRRPVVRNMTNPI